MDKEEIRDMIRQEIKDNLSLMAQEKNGMYHDEKYVRISVLWDGEEIDYVSVDIPVVD